MTYINHALGMGSPFTKDDYVSIKSVIVYYYKLFYNMYIHELTMMPVVWYLCS